MKLSSSKITFIICLILVGSLSVSTFAQNKGSISLFPDQAKLKINKDIYGHFAEHLGACIYGGFWVGEKSPIPNTDGIRNDVVNALRQISIPNLRWPGGCFADTYHWKDGIGPKEKRPSIINTNWGGVTEDNSFGTHEFMRLTELLGCDAYINGNIGSGTVQEMSEWVEYLTSSNESPMTKLRKENGRDKPWKVKYWAVGNETWGCGGNMTPDYYGNLFRQYSTFMHDFAGNRLEKVASGASDTDYNWMEIMMKNPKNREMMQGICRALKPGGQFYASFKAGEADGRDTLNRYYNYPSPEWLRATYAEAGRWSSLSIETGEVRGFDNEQASMLFVVAQKSP